VWRGSASCRPSRSRLRPPAVGSAHLPQAPPTLPSAPPTCCRLRPDATSHRLRYLRTTSTRVRLDSLSLFVVRINGLASRIVSYRSSSSSSSSSSDVFEYIGETKLSCKCRVAWIGQLSTIPQQAPPTCRRLRPPVLQVPCGVGGPAVDGARQLCSGRRRDGAARVARAQDFRLRRRSLLLRGHRPLLPTVIQHSITCSPICRVYGDHLNISGKAQKPLTCR